MLNEIEDFVKNYKLKHKISLNNIIRSSNLFAKFIKLKKSIKRIRHLILSHFLIYRVINVLRRNCNRLRKIRNKRFRQVETLNKQTIVNRTLINIKNIILIIVN